MRAPKVQTLPSLVVIALGLALMVVKIAADSEPGAIPLLLLAIGFGWLAVTQRRARSPRRGSR